MSAPWLQIKLKSWQRAEELQRLSQSKSKMFALNPWGHEVAEGNKGYIFSISSVVTEETTDSYVCIGLFHYLGKPALLTTPNIE